METFNEYYLWALPEGKIHIRNYPKKVPKLEKL